MNKQCLLEMQGAYIQAINSYSYDITGLYLKLEQIFKNYFKSGFAKEGDVFSFEMGLGMTITMKFYQDATEVYGRNYLIPDSEREVLLSREASIKKEYDILKGFGQAMHLAGLAIGPHYSKHFERILNHLQTGQMISFEEGKTYVCCKHDGPYLTLKRVFDGDLENIDVDKFIKDSETYELNINNLQEMQLFYQKNRKGNTNSAEADIIIMDKYLLTVKEIEKDISLLHSKRVDLGPLSFVVKKHLLDNTVVWYAGGKQIPKDTVAYLMAYLSSSPTITKYIRNNPTEIKTALDAAKQSEIEKMLNHKQYEQAFQEMCRYSKEQTKDLTIKTSTFIKREDKYIASALVFQDGSSFLIEYPNGDFNAAPNIVKELSKSEFVKFCEQKYDAYHEIAYANTLEEIEKLYPTVNENIKKNQSYVAENLAIKKMEKTNYIFEEGNFQFGPSDLDDLIQNKKDNPQLDDFLEELE